MSEEIDSQWTAEGFNRRFEEIMKEGKNNDMTYFQAYYQTETEHLTKFKKHRYKNYDSFRQTRLQLIKSGKI